MPIYADYTAEDFAQDDFFRQWVLQPNAETNQFWVDFLELYPEKQPVVVAGRALLNAFIQVQIRPTLEQGHRMWATIEQRVQEEDDAATSATSRSYQIGFRWQWLAAAASIVLLLGLGWWFMVKPVSSSSQGAYSDKQSQPAVAWVEKANKTKQPLRILLTDGSRVVLQPQSNVRYPENFSALKREVYLTGEGFFEVVKNPEQPFLVYTDGLVTQVVGTSFTVKAPPQMTQVIVRVRTGKVAVFTSKALRSAQENQTKITNMLLLTPNQQVVFDKPSDQLTKSLIKEPLLIKQPENDQHFVFQNAPVSKIFQTLEESYGVTIKYNAELFKHCNLTAPLSNEPLFRKLDLICQTIGATYEVWGTDIIISGKGCQ